MALCFGGETEAWCKAELGSLAQGHAQASVTIPGLACVGKDVLGFGWGKVQGTSIPALGSRPPRRLWPPPAFLRSPLGTGGWELCPDALAGILGDAKLGVLLGRGHV